MSLIGLVIVLIVVGILLWLVTTQLPIDATIKKINHIVVTEWIIVPQPKCPTCGSTVAGIDQHET